MKKAFQTFLVWFAIFLAINFIITSFFNPQEANKLASEDFVSITNSEEYSKGSEVILKLQTNQEKAITYSHQCEKPPFEIFRLSGTNKEKVESNIQLKCEGETSYTLEPGQETSISYIKWANTLFSENGRYIIEGQIEDQNFQSNEFLIKDKGWFMTGWENLIYQPIYNTLIFLISLVPGNNLGLAIVILTLILRTILLIPTHKSLKSQREMQKMQPKLEAIRKKYKNNQEKIAMETMKIWKEHKVNPLSSCLPLLIQFPILIALFYVIQSGLNPDQAVLLYGPIADFQLSQIDTIFLGILDLATQEMFVLPLIIGGLQFFQLRMLSSKIKQNQPKKKKKKKKKEDAMPDMQAANKMMQYIMPVMIAIFTATLPAGVGLYWGTSTLYSIGQQYFIQRNEDKNKKPKEPQVKVIS